jgi:hypothetical protein
MKGNKEEQAIWLMNVCCFFFFVDMMTSVGDRRALAAFLRFRDPTLLLLLHLRKVNSIDSKPLEPIADIVLSMALLVSNEN